ncbi:pre-mRNA splicing regulator USH1G [Paramormyrops kingsleyae]|uniref:pre-mRNA splicing regulator USH1G n=1 Tax=Paramormyrops kingsleyae TaxID=1676925 RepID=UPI003B96F469
MMQKCVRTMTDRYQRAARDGHLGLLKEATRRDLNGPDEDGMTPALWAAYHGNLAALRLIAGKGGDLDKCDIWGSTPLHLAAANGHLNCVSFLVSFGTNVWCLDNDSHTALEVAASRGHINCVRYLDSVVARQEGLNPKLVGKLKERAQSAMQRRTRAGQNAWREHQDLLERYDYWGGQDAMSFYSYTSSKTFGISTSRISLSQATLQSVAKGKAKIQKMLQRRKQVAGAFAVAEDAPPPAGLTRAYDVMFPSHTCPRDPLFRPRACDMFPFGDSDAISRAVSDPGLCVAELVGSQARMDLGYESLFSRPGMGTVMFRRTYCPGAGTGATVPGRRMVGTGPALWRSPSLDSCLLEWDQREAPWGSRLSLGADAGGDDASPLEAFLAAWGASEFLPVFQQEKITLDVLLICSDHDLEGVRIPLGPRRKIMEGCRRRREALQDPGDLQDTKL